MAWLDRGGRSYEYKSVREGDRVRSRYVPGSALPADVGDMLRQRDRQARERAAEDRATWAAERAVMAEADRLAASIDQEYRAVAELALVACGFRQNKRGRWHRRRAIMPKTQPKPSAPALPSAAEVHALLDLRDRAKADGTDDPASRKATVEAFEALRAAARDGFEDALPGIRVFFERRGGMLEFTRLSDRAFEAAAERGVPEGDLLSREALVRQIREVRDRLVVPDSPELEMLLAERVALAWFDAMRADIAAHSMTDGAVVAKAEYLSRQQGLSQARFHAACKSLAVVRRLALPVLHLHRDVTPPQPVATTHQSDRLRIVADGTH